MHPRKCDSVNGVTVLVLLGVFFLLCISLEPRFITINNDTDWDVLIFTQNWPNSVCLQWKEKSPNSTCNLPTKNNEWTIHGIWPTKLGTLGPWFCDPSKPFNMEEIYGIIDRLEDQWMRVQNHKKRTAFWKHEWEKHGTCAAQLVQLNTEFKYFYQGLIWNNLYNITEILTKANLNPGTNNMKSQQVIDAVKTFLGKNPYVSCYQDPKTKEVYLLEVRLCFDKSLKLTDCDGVRLWAGAGSSNLTDCPLDQPLLYPLTVPPPPLFLRQSPIYKTLKLISLIQWATF